MKKAVIIGAGQTGRGFIAPILDSNRYHLTFLDKDEALIRQLKEEKLYLVRYFGGKREERVIENYQAYSVEDPAALEELLEAELIFVSVFASHVAELTELFKKAAAKKKDGKLTIVCCENGVHVKKPLTDAGLDAVISEGIIFCTTLSPDRKKLDLISQDYPELPLDGGVEGFHAEIKGMPLEKDFSSLIQRKIYTYNFISAIVAYLGSYKGYEVYGEAANDPDVEAVIEQAEPVISRVIGQRYQVDYEVQKAFTRTAIEKFQNKEIYDTIDRNAQQAERKLGKGERLLTPLKLACQYGEDTGCMELVTAAAIYYGLQKEKLDLEKTMSHIREAVSEDGGTEVVEQIRTLLSCFQKGESLEEILAEMKRP